ncbi:hypothetical protein AB5I41_21165 [Sphingomonas sp. MMS24-JH45]
MLERLGSNAGLREALPGEFTRASSHERADRARRKRKVWPIYWRPKARMRDGLRWPPPRGRSAAP